MYVAVGSNYRAPSTNHLRKICVKGLTKNESGIDLEIVLK